MTTKKMGGVFSAMVFVLACIAGVATVFFFFESESRFESAFLTTPISFQSADDIDIDNDYDYDYDYDYNYDNDNDIDNDSNIIDNYDYDYDYDIYVQW